MRYYQLKENPVSDLEIKLFGSDGDRFKERDQKYILSPKYKDIVIKKLSHVPFDLYVYILDTPKTRKIETASGGGSVYSLFYDFTERSDLYDLIDIVGVDIVEKMKNKPDAVHQLIVHNDPESINWMPLTPWMILHRLSHAVLDAGQRGTRINIVGQIIHFMHNAQKSFYDYLKDHNLKYTYPANNKLFASMFDFKSSAGEKPEQYEMWIELFAAYLHSGGIVKIKETGNSDIDAIGQRIKEQLSPMFFELTQVMKNKAWVG